MSSEPASPATMGMADRRLHRFSWLFLLVGQLKQFGLPLIVLLVTGQQNDIDYVSIGIMTAMVVGSLAQYLTYRYGVDADGVVIRSGLLQRNLRHIPFGRIQNVTIHQSLLHRICGVAEVRLESGRAPKPEGQMRVLSLVAANALERDIREHGRSAAVADMPPIPATTLLSLSFTEVIRLGLIDNRGMLVTGGAVLILSQMGDVLLFDRLIDSLSGWFVGHADLVETSRFVLFAASLALVLLVLAVIRMISVIIAIGQFHGFTLCDHEGRLTIERGLLTRTRGTVPRHRIQAFSLSEGLLHRLFHRQSLRVDSAVTEAANESRSMRDLVPLATPATMNELVARLLPGGTWPIEGWKPLHPNAWKREFSVPAVFTVVVTVMAVCVYDVWALWLLLLVPLLYGRAIIWARHSAYSTVNGVVAFRGGWLDRHWHFAETGKLQAVELLQSPFDRHHGMATLRFDTAGGNPRERRISIPYLGLEDAQEIHRQLSLLLSKT